MNRLTTRVCAVAGPVTAILAVQCPKAELSRCPALNPRQKSYMEVRGYRIWHELRVTQKGNFCVTLEMPPFESPSALLYV